MTPLDSDGGLTAVLEGLGATALDSELATFISNTQGADDISVATVQTQANALTGVAGTTAGEAADIIAELAYPFVETGQFLLSFNGGVLKGLIDLGWIKVFTDAGDALFSL